MQSKSLQIYKRWLQNATPEQVAFVDSVYAECEKHYEAGGSTVVECFTPEEVIEQFKTVNDARKFCGLKVEQALNARWGEDNDPELKVAKEFKQWKEPKK